jgi:hypothetical protein
MISGGSFSSGSAATAMVVIKQNATRKTQLHAPLLYFLRNIPRQNFSDKKAELLSVLEKFARIIVTPLNIRRSTSLFALGLPLGTLVATSCDVVPTDATMALLASHNRSLTDTNISGLQAVLLSLQTCWPLWAGITPKSGPDGIRGATRNCA